MGSLSPIEAIKIVGPSTGNIVTLRGDHLAGSLSGILASHKGDQNCWNLKWNPCRP